MDDIQTIFGRIEAGHVVVFLGSGAAGGRTFASKKTRAATLGDPFVERLTGRGPRDQRRGATFESVHRAARAASI